MEYSLLLICFENSRSSFTFIQIYDFIEERFCCELHGMYLCEIEIHF